jgi:hypothetical protein
MESAEAFYSSTNDVRECEEALRQRLIRVAEREACTKGEYAAATADVITVTCDGVAEVRVCRRSQSPRVNGCSFSTAVLRSCGVCRCAVRI